MVDMDFTPSSVPPYPAESNSRRAQSSTNLSGVDDDLAMVAYEIGESSTSSSCATSTPYSEDAHDFRPIVSLVTRP